MMPAARQEQSSVTVDYLSPEPEKKITGLIMTEEDKLILDKQTW
jgi:hypothetical protein